jgi:hypothetical protein
MMAMLVFPTIWLSAWFGWPGRLLVALLLPVVFMGSLCMLTLALGVVAWPLMPVAVAAEWGDQFDALSRSYSDAFQRPLRFVFLTALAAALALLPFPAVFYLFPQEPPAAAFYAVAALCLSIFWSLESLVYLHLRAAIDGVSAGDLANCPEPVEEGKRRARLLGRRESAPASGPPLVGLPRFALRLACGLAVAASSWYLTVYLFTRFSDGPTDWLDWGLTGVSRAPRGGVTWAYQVASVVAGFWGVVWLAMAVLLVLRRAQGRGGAAPHPDLAEKSTAVAGPAPEAGAAE